MYEPNVENKTGNECADEFAVADAGREHERNELSLLDLHKTVSN